MPPLAGWRRLNAKDSMPAASGKYHTMVTGPGFAAPCTSAWRSPGIAWPIWLEEPLTDAGHRHHAGQGGAGSYRPAPPAGAEPLPLRDSSGLL